MAPEVFRLERCEFPHSPRGILQAGLKSLSDVHAGVIWASNEAFGESKISG
jgi:hypothetical protein